MTTNDIESHMRELYDIEISDSTISRITDRILPIVEKWQERPLEEIYAVVFMDAIHNYVRNEGRIVKRTVYIAIGIDMEDLAFDPKRSEEPRHGRYPDRMCRRTDRLSSGNGSCFPGY